MRVFVREFVCVLASVRAFVYACACSFVSAYMLACVCACVCVWVSACECSCERACKCEGVRTFVRVSVRV